MSSIEERISALIDANLEIEGRAAGQSLNLDRNVAEDGADSANIVAFWQLVCEEFGVDISAEEFAELLTPRDLIAHLEAATG